MRQHSDSVTHPVKFARKIMHDDFFSTDGWQKAVGIKDNVHESIFHHRLVNLFHLMGDIFPGKRHCAPAARLAKGFSFVSIEF